MKYLLLTLPLILTGCVTKSAPTADSSFIKDALDMAMGVFGGAGDVVADSSAVSALAMGSPAVSGLLVAWNLLRGRRLKKTHKKEREHFKSKETGSALFLHAIRETSTIGEAKIIADLGIKAQEGADKTI